MLQELNLPPINIKTKQLRNTLHLYDPFRRKFVKATPEEWVRQHFLGFLVDHRKVPASHIAVEKQIKIAQASKRYDAIIVDNNLNNLAIIELKAPAVKISQNSFSQIAAYNTILKAPYLLVSNGIEHYSCHINFSSSSIEFLDHIPDYQEMITSSPDSL